MNQPSLKMWRKTIGTAFALAALFGIAGSGLVAFAFAQEAGGSSLPLSLALSILGFFLLFPMGFISGWIFDCVNPELSDTIQIVLMFVLNGFFWAFAITFIYPWIKARNILPKLKERPAASGCSQPATRRMTGR